MPTQRTRKPIILVIDDYRDSREMLKLLLESLNYRVLEAANGHEALALAASSHLDLILTDFGLPDMEGSSVVQRLRKLNDRLRHVPIIMLTALDGEEYYYRALSAGCTDFLTKPLDFKTLQALIERLLRETHDDREDTPNGVQLRES
jgi:DNA-binding response OmpR family regulator